MFRFHSAPDRNEATMGRRRSSRRWRRDLSARTIAFKSSAVSSMSSFDQHVVIVPVAVDLRGTRPASLPSMTSGNPAFFPGGAPRGRGTTAASRTSSPLRAHASAPAPRPGRRRRGGCRPPAPGYARSPASTCHTGLPWTSAHSRTLPPLSSPELVAGHEVIFHPSCSAPRGAPSYRTRKSKFANEASSFETTVVFPEPEGAEITKRAPRRPLIDVLHLFADGSSSAFIAMTRWESTHPGIWSRWCSPRGSSPGR